MCREGWGPAAGGERPARSHRQGIEARRELIADQRFHSLLPPRRLLTLEALVEWLAGKLGIAYHHIDPLTIDLVAVPGTMPIPSPALYLILPVAVPQGEFTAATRRPLAPASIAPVSVLLPLWACVHGYVPKSLNVVELPAALKAIFEGTVYVPSFLTEMSPSAADSRLPSDAVSDVAPAQKLGALTPRQQDVLHLLVDSTSKKGLGSRPNLTAANVNGTLRHPFRISVSTPATSDRRRGTATGNRPSRTRWRWCDKNSGRTRVFACRVTTPRW